MNPDFEGCGRVNVQVNREIRVAAPLSTILERASGEASWEGPGGAPFEGVASESKVNIP